MSKLLFQLKRVWMGIYTPYKIASALISVILIFLVIVSFGFFDEPTAENDTYQVIALEDEQQCIVLEKDSLGTSCNIISNIDEKKNIVFYTNQRFILEEDYELNPDYTITRRSAILQQV